MIPFKRLLAVIVAAVGLLGACGGSENSSAGKAADAYLGEMRDIADAVENITDEDSARAAAKVIRDATASLDKISDSYDGEWDSISAMAALNARRKEFVDVQMRVSSAMAKLGAQQPQLMQMVSEEMSKMPELGG